MEIYMVEYQLSEGSNNNSNETYHPQIWNLMQVELKQLLEQELSLGFFKIFADYTLQEYNTLSAGIALSIR